MAKGEGYGVVGNVSSASATSTGENQASVDVGKSASLVAGRQLQILAGEKGGALSLAFTELKGGAFVKVTSADATDSMNHTSLITVQSSANLAAPDLLRIGSQVGSPYTSFLFGNRANPVSDAGGFAGSTNATAKTDVSRFALVRVLNDAGTPTMRTSNLQVTTDTQINPVETKPDRKGFVLFDVGSSKKEEDGLPLSSITFFADVTITGPATFVRIDRSGNVTHSQDVGVDKQSGWYAVSPIDSSGGGQAVLQAKGGVIPFMVGAATFTYTRGGGGATIINQDPTRDLIVGDVGVAGSGNVTPRLTVSPSGFSGTFTTGVVDARPVPVTIASASNVVLTGVINNPLGPVTVSAPNGTIARAIAQYLWVGTSGINFGLFSPNSFRQQIVGSQVALSGVAVGSPTGRVHVQLPAGPSLTATARRGDVYLDLSAQNPQGANQPAPGATLTGRTVDVTFADGGTSSNSR